LFVRSFASSSSSFLVWQATAKAAAAQEKTATKRAEYVTEMNGRSLQRGSREGGKEGRKEGNGECQIESRLGLD
jgi:hypothetical protein